MYEITGTVKLVEEKQTFGSGFEKQEFIVTTEDKYPQDVKLEATKEKCELVAALGVGDSVTVSFNIRGREYKGRYFVNLQAWRIETLSESHNNASEDTSEDLEEDVPF